MADALAGSCIASRGSRAPILWGWRTYVPCASDLEDEGSGKGWSDGAISTPSCATHGLNMLQVKMLLTNRGSYDLKRMGLPLINAERKMCNHTSTFVLDIQAKEFA